MNAHEHRWESRLVNPRLVLGLFAIALGLVLTLDNLDLLDADPILDYWPVVLILLGMVKILRTEGGRLVGVLLTLAGSWLLLFNIGVHPYELQDFWPLFLILAGAALILTSFRSRTRGKGVVDLPTVSAFALIGGHRQTNACQHFRGGDLAAVAGACILDLRPAATEGTAVIEVFAFWGGVEIHVPETWTVESRVVPFMGGYEDSTRSPAVDTGNHLLVKGFAWMGAVEVNNGPGSGEAGDEDD